LSRSLPRSVTLLLPPSSPPPFPYTTLFRSRLTECLSNILTGFSLRRGEFTSAVLHHVENVINTDFAISGHLLDNVARGAELRRRSEEHTSELQSRFDLVCRLLLEKKKTKEI